MNSLSFFLLFVQWIGYFFQTDNQLDISIMEDEIEALTSIELSLRRQIEKEVSIKEEHRNV